MAARSTWKGYLKLSLVSVPVKAYTATVSGGGEVHLNQLHAPCHSRIQYKKTCPIHGEVKNDEIVSGYESSKDQYVVIEPEELDKLRTEDDKAIKIDKFISPDALDPMYWDRTYYLVPDGPVGQSPFAVLRQAMVDENRYALAQVVLSGKEQIVLLRPLEQLLLMTVLSLDNEISKPTAFADQVPRVEVAPEEVKLAKTLIEASTSKTLDYSRYKDVYTEKLMKLIEAKVEGKEIVAPPATEHAQVINLMDALRQSVAQAQQAAAPAEKPAAAAKPPKKMAASVKKTAAAKKKKQA